MLGITFAMLASVFSPQAALAQNGVPAALAAPGMTVYLELSATGAQVYTCAKNDAGAFAWTLKAPDAQLFDKDKKPFGKHYAGPTWEGNDGGKVVGTAKANASSPSGSIPWLLLDVKSREGNGALTQAKAVQRINTAGGVAPATGCDAAHAGAENRSSYTATYLFLK